MLTNNGEQQEFVDYEEKDIRHRTIREDTITKTTDRTSSDETKQGSESERRGLDEDQTTLEV